MRKFLLAAAFALLSAFAAPTFAEDAPVGPTVEAAANLPGDPVDSTVLVYGGNKIGTGTIWGPGLIITAAHILVEQDQVIKLRDGSFIPTVGIYKNDLLDFAILKPLNAVPRGVEINCDMPRPGDKFTWTGMPLGFEWNLGQGFVSTLETHSTRPWYIGVSATVNHGDSGAGLFDKDNKLFAIIIGMMGEDATGNAFVLPAANFCGAIMDTISKLQ